VLQGSVNEKKENKEKIVDSAAMQTGQKNAVPKSDGKKHRKKVIKPERSVKSKAMDMEEVV